MKPEERTQDHNSEYLSLESGETLIWQAQPSAPSFVFSDSLLIAFAPVWAAVVLFFSFLFGKEGITLRFLLYDCLFLLPLWLAFAEIIYLASVRTDVRYCITSKRVIVQKKKQVLSLPLFDIAMIEAGGNFFSRANGSGTILFFLKQPGNRHGQIPHTLNLPLPPWRFKAVPELKRVTGLIEDALAAQAIRNPASWEARPAAGAYILTSMGKPIFITLVSVLITWLIQKSWHSAGEGLPGVVVTFMVLAMLPAASTWGGALYSVLAADGIRYRLRDGNLSIASEAPFHHVFIPSGGVTRVDYSNPPMQGAGTVSVYAGRYQVIRGRGSYFYEEIPEKLKAVENPGQVADIIRGAAIDQGRSHDFS